MLLRLLDAPHWELGGLRVDLPSTLLGWLAAYLAVQGDWVGREQVGVLLWPDEAKERAQHNLRVNLHRLRGLLRSQGVPAIVEADARRLRLKVPTDVEQFRDAMARGAWPVAVGLHRRPLLADAALPGFEALSEWAEMQRASLLDQWRDACIRRAAQLGEAREFAAAAELLERVLQLDPLAEDVMQDLLRCMVATGSVERARDEYRRFADRLRADLGVVPQQATAEIVAFDRPAPLPRTPAQAARAPATLVGRAAELKALAAAAARIVIIDGPAGVGKTRLVDAAFPRASRLHCRQGMEAVPYFPLAQYLRQRDHSAIDAAVALSGCSVLTSSATTARDVAGAATHGDGAVARQLLFDAAAAALRRTSEQVVLEDVQWADAATCAFLRHLARAGDFVIVVTARSEDRRSDLAATLTQLRSTAATFEMHVDGLDADGLRALAADALGVDVPADVGAWLKRRTGGNPLLAGLTLRSMRESAALQQALRAATVPAWRTWLQEAELRLPSQVEELLRAQVAPLSRRALRLMEALSVLQEPASLALAATVGGLSTEEVVAGWEEAEERRIADPAGIAHELLRVYIHGEMPAARRRLLHARVAQILAGRGDFAQVAEHWMAAGDPELAATYWYKRARQLHAESLAAEAADLYAKVLASARSPERRRAAALDRAVALCDLVEFEQAARELLSLLPALVDRRARAVALMTLARSRAGMGKVTEAWALLQEARATAAGLDDRQLGFDLDELEHVLLIRQGKTAEAFERLRPHLEGGGAGRPSRRLAQLWLSFSTWHIDQGRLESGIEAAQRALALARDLGSHPQFVYAAANLLNAFALLGRSDEAFPVVEAALALGRTDGSDLLRSNLARAYLLRNEPWRALPHAERVAREARGTFIEGVALGTQAEALARLGRPADARDAIQRALLLLPETDVAMVRAAIVLTVATCGDDAQLAQAMAFVPALAGSQLPPATVASLKKRLAARGVPWPPEFEAAPAP